MFKGNLNQLYLVSGLPEKIMECIISVKNSLEHNVDVGTYPLLEDKAFFFIVDDHTELLEKRRSECHQKYIDVQIVLEGEETFGYSEYPFLSLDENLFEEKDIAFSEDIINEQFVTLQSGDFIVFTAEQPH
ncbi:MAG: biofilm protein TabA, partial [Oceanospirillaceae bacterium]